jgi:metal-sulfur cluster biosynthetic enzyme
MADITKEQVLKVLERVNDPELRLNIVDLGLVYNVEITEDNNVGIDMTLTTQACPVGPLIQMQAEAALKAIPGVNQVDVRLVFDPPWTPDKMSERLKKARQMGLL